MTLSRSSSGPPRQGVILLVVVLMLTLFMVVGISFVLYAESEATAARTYREAPLDKADVPPEELLAWALGQLIYPVPDDAAELVIGGPTNLRWPGGGDVPGIQPGNPLEACSPVPATVLTLLAFKSALRIMWFSLSATYSVSPLRAQPCG